MVSLPRYGPFTKEECKTDPTIIDPFIFIERGTERMGWERDSRQNQPRLVRLTHGVFCTHLPPIIEYPKMIAFVLV